MPITVRKAVRDLLRRKLRAALTLVGILIGVAGIVAIITTSTNLTTAQTAAYNNNSQQDFSWWVGGAGPGLVNALAEVPNVAAVERRADYYTKWWADGTWRDMRFLGLEDFAHQAVNRVDLVAGHWPERGEVVLEVSVQSVAPVAIGDELVYRFGPNNDRRSLIVSGFAKSPSYPAANVIGTSIAYANAREVRQMFGWDADNSLLVRLKNFDLKDDTRKEIELTMDRRGLAHASFRQRDPANYPGKRELDALILMMFTFSLVGLVISGFLVANTLAAVVGEQIGEIGAMKAIGATSGRIMRIYVLAGLIYGVIGTGAGLLLGIAFGYGLLLYLAGLLNLTIGSLYIEPLAFLAGAAIGVGVTVGAALFPAWRGTAIPVRQALESYGISATYGRGALDRLVQRVARLPRIPAMAIRNLARRKSRNVITGLVVALATGAFLAALGTSASVDRSIDDLYGLYDVDAWVWFQNPVGQSFTTSLHTLPQVREVEAWANSGGTIEDTRTSVWGLPFDTTLYKKQLIAGRWYTDGEQGVALITAKLAAARGMVIGERFTLQTGGEEALLRVIGIVEDNAAALGSTAVGKVFLPLDVLSRLLHRQGAADFFGVRFADHDPASVDAALTDLERRFRTQAPGMAPAYQDKASSKEASQILSYLLYAMVVIVGVIGGIGIANTLTLNVLERRREIGVMRAIGAGDGHLVQTFLTEALALGGGGYLFGLLIGVPLTWLFNTLLGAVLFPITFVFPPQNVLLAAVFTLLLTLVASVGPALGAARMRVGTALRYE
jgi:putative ABC transport system permease protein